MKSLTISFSSHSDVSAIGWGVTTTTDHPTATTPPPPPMPPPSNTHRRHHPLPPPPIADFIPSSFAAYQTTQVNDSFHSHMVTKEDHGMVMIHFIPLSIPFLRPFHYLIPNRPLLIILKYRNKC
ncbi:hypothetical protein Hanom_Chr13g01197381 [Helianthus anomalus]